MAASQFLPCKNLTGLQRKKFSMACFIWNIRDESLLGQNPKSAVSKVKQINKAKDFLLESCFFFSRLKIFIFKRLFRNIKDDNLSEQDPKSTVSMVKQIIKAKKIFLESCFLQLKTFTFYCLGSKRRLQNST